jgi:hypothetical protein
VAFILSIKSGVGVRLVVLVGKAERCVAKKNGR